MKTVSQIPLNNKDNSPLNLLIELSDQGISILWFTKKPFLIKAINVYVFDENDQIVEEVGKIISQIKSTQSEISHVHLCYNYKDSVIVPEQYNLENIHTDILNLMYGPKDAYHAKTEKTSVPKLFNQYRFPNDLNNLLSEQFDITTQAHSGSLQIKNESDEISLYCIVFYDTIKILLHKEGKLQNIQQYKYNLPDDVLYHILNTCGQYGINAAETTLKLSGMIVKDSMLFNQLYNNFLNIQLVEIPNNISENDEISNLPLHFFTHLTDLASCV